MDYDVTFEKLKGNSPEVADETIRILDKIADNILRFPTDTKYRTLQKTNGTIRNKILLAKGGIDCLKLMGFQEVCIFAFFCY